MIEPSLRAELDALYADYGAALDDRRYDDWLDLFTEDCSYLLQPRENFDRGLPLATLSFESKGMLRDRVYGITQTLFHAPYYQRHLIGPLRVTAIGPGAAPDAPEAPDAPDAPDAEGGTWQVAVEAPYAVFRTRLHQLSEVFNVGRYLDTVVRERRGGRLRFAAKRAIFDSEMIPNSIIYPI